MADPLHSDADRARLAQVLRFLIALCLGGTPLNVGLALAFGSTTLYGAAGVVMGIGALALVALLLARRGRVYAAVYTTGATVLVGATLLIVFLPALIATMTMVPMVAVALLMPYLAPRAALRMSILCVLITPVIFLLGEFPLPFVEQPSRAATLALGTIGVCAVPALIALLLWQYHARVTATVAQTLETNLALEQARADLEQQVAARTADLRGALADVQARAAAQAQLLAENSEQRDVIREMSVPVLPVTGNAIAIPLIGALDGGRLQLVQELALQAISASHARFVLLDVTGVPVVDTQVAQGIIAVVAAARLLGAEAVLVGVRPEVAQTIVSLGIDLQSVTTRQSLYEGIAYTGHRA
jgi:rsbT co-antagonist protein RsbR